MQRTKLIATEVAMPTTAGAASSISEATCVRLVNGSNQPETISISTAVGAASTISFTLPHHPHVEFLQKASTDVIFASSASVKAAKVGFTN
jgi:hypothetical protein